VKLNHIIPILLLLAGVLLLPQCSFAQESDANLWTRFALKYDISKNTRLAVEEEFRFFNNASMLEENHTEIGIKSEIVNRLNLGAYYRFIYETDVDRYYSLGHKGWLQIEYLLLDKDLEISVRNRLQATVQNLHSSENGHIPDWYNRYKLSIEYKPKKAVWVPSGDIELWHALNPKGKPMIDKLRATTGLEYRYNSNWRWQIFYAFQKELQVANPGTDHIWGIASTYLIN